MYMLAAAYRTSYGEQKSSMSSGVIGLAAQSRSGPKHGSQDTMTPIQQGLHWPAQGIVIITYWRPKNLHQYLENSMLKPAPLTYPVSMRPLYS